MAAAGNALGGQIFDAAARGLGQEDTRTTGQRAVEAGVEFVAGGLGQAAGPFVSKGISKVLTSGTRLGSRGIQKLANTLKDFSLIGETPTLGQAGSVLGSVVESVAGRTVGGVRVIKNKAADLVRGFDQSVQKRVVQLGGGSIEEAGETLIKGVSGFADRFQIQADKLYSKLSGFVSPGSRATLNNTSSVLDDLVKIDPASPEFTGKFVNKGLLSIKKALEADTAAGGGGVSFSALQLARTRVGQKLSNPSIIDDVARADWKQLYSALTKDMLDVVSREGGEAGAKAFSAANTFWKNGITKIDDVLQPLIRNKLPGRVFNALENSGKFGPSLLREVQDSVTQKEWNILVGTTLQRMGQATAGNQNAAGTQFSIKTFLKNWGSLKDGTREILFNKTGIPGMKGDLDTLARVSERIVRAAESFSNPSGTAQVTLAGVQIGGGVQALLSGNLGTAAALLAVLPAMSLGGAKFVTSPTLVRWLAKGAKIQPNGIAAHLARLTAIGIAGDADTREAVREYLNAFATLPQPSEDASTLPGNRIRQDNFLETRKRIKQEAAEARLRKIGNARP